MDTITQNPTGLTVGQTVKHSSSAVQRARDYWLQRGRCEEKASAKQALDNKIAERGTVREIAKGKFAWVVSVEWRNGNRSECLSYMVEPA